MEDNMKKRALRRHHKARILKKRKRDLWWFYDWTMNHKPEEEGRFNININSCPACSCTMCGNPRRHFGYIRKQEIRSYIRMIEQCAESEVYTRYKSNNIPRME